MKRAQGIRLGHPVFVACKGWSVRIRRERAKGKTLAAIADGLNREGVPTAQGGRAWYPATVRTVLLRTA